MGPFIAVNDHIRASAYRRGPVDTILQDEISTGVVLTGRAIFRLNNETDTKINAAVNALLGGTTTVNDNLFLSLHDFLFQYNCDDSSIL